MRPLANKIKPASGYSQLLHVAYRLTIPVIVLVLVRLGIGLWLPITVILLSKWRILAVRPRFWPANLRANAIDIIFGISMVLFMARSGSLAAQLIWTVLYGFWLLFIKPRSSILYTSLQAALGQLAGLTALFIIAGESITSGIWFMYWSELPIGAMVLLTGLICYLSARHFFDAFNEPYAKMLSYIWGYFGAALLWVLGHMLIVYPRQDGIIAMPTLILSAIGYGLGAIYYLEHFDRLSGLIRREVLIISGAIVTILLVSLYYEGAHLIT